MKKLLFLMLGNLVLAQKGTLIGHVKDDNSDVVVFATVNIPSLGVGSYTDEKGNYNLKNIPYGRWRVVFSLVGYEYKTLVIQVNSDVVKRNITLKHKDTSLDEVVVSGTMKEVSRLKSPVPVEVYSAKFLNMNPVASVFEAVQNINGVRPQINCNVCNTGDIHINGLEGPNTMVLIDGMPIVSGLGTVYGLSGIPKSLISRMEVVKGPASTLYGSEAVAGLINIITKKTHGAPVLSVDTYMNTWAETNTDIATKFSLNPNVQSLLGINYFNYQNPIDHNRDNFTDVALQNRISVFNKWNFDRPGGHLLALAGRYLYEDRWGGDVNWTKANRGGSSVYGESIYTGRWEIYGAYQLPFNEKITMMLSANGHHQNSAYGNNLYIADQNIGFGQLLWDKNVGDHDLLVGLTYRYTYYDDNTPATASFDNSGNNPSRTVLPGIFVQDEIDIDKQNKLLVGMRYDRNSIHGNIYTPRANYKWSSANGGTVLRLSVGSGYRVAYVFTEDHAALTGARNVVFLHDLKPERSWNGNLNLAKKINIGGMRFDFDATAFYTYFKNKIIPDYDTNPNKIIYDNLKGHAVSEGVSMEIHTNSLWGVEARIGATAMNVYRTEGTEQIRQLFSERFTGVWGLTYNWDITGLKIDYTGNLYSPMRLPLLGDLDPRPEYSPWWSIQNIQLTKTFNNGLEFYGGVKNILDWTPGKKSPFLIAGSKDPFDKQVQFNADGIPKPTPQNPYALTFDPAYVYASNQGIRFFLGVRYSLF